jgi:hypothetical protein
LAAAFAGAAEVPISASAPLGEPVIAGLALACETGLARGVRFAGGMGLTCGVGSAGGIGLTCGVGSAGGIGLICGADLAGAAAGLVAEAAFFARGATFFAGTDWRSRVAPSPEVGAMAAAESPAGALVAGVSWCGASAGGVFAGGVLAGAASRAGEEARLLGATLSADGFPGVPEKGFWEGRPGPSVAAGAPSG